MRFEQRGAKTVLGPCRFKLPLQALAPAELADGTLYLMLLNPTGGVVGGDYLLTQVVLEDGTHVCFTTPSATRVYRTTGQPAIQETYIQVADNSLLEYLPDHVIPYKGSRFRQSLRVDLGCKSRTIIWDALAAGRVACGELWEFHEIDSRIEILLRGRQAFLNRTWIHPAKLDPRRFGIAEGWNYLATLLLLADMSEDWKRIAAAMDTELENLPQVYGGTSALASSGCVVKLLARSAADLTSAQIALWTRARQLLFGAAPVCLRKY